MAERPQPPGTHRGTRAVQRLVEFAPATGGLALWVRHRDVPADDAAAALIATDGHAIHYGAGFSTLPVELQAGWVAHEVLHIALRHVQRGADLQALLGDVDRRLFNTCADAIVNSALGHLGWLQLPALAVRLEQLLAAALGLHRTAEQALLEWDVERLYRAIDDRHGQGQDGSRRQDGPRAATTRALGGQMHADLLPAPAPAPAAAAGPLQQADAQVPADMQAHAPEAQAEVTRTWRERLLRAHAGDGAFSMLRTVVADLPQTRTPWEQVLRTQLARGLSRRPALSWSRPARSYIANQGRAGPGRRLPWEPGFSGTVAVPRLVVVLDVSGSIEAALLERFAREVQAITRRLEAALVLVTGDDRVHDVRRFEPGRCDLRAVAFQGGGGTDFTPLLQEADRHRPDIGIVLTDLQGPATFQPRWPVIWAVPEPHDAAVAPFGRKLSLR